MHEIVPRPTILTRPDMHGPVPGYACMRMGRTGSPLAAARHEAAQVHKAPVGDVLAIDVHALALPAQEVRCVDRARAAAVHRIKCVPVRTTAEERLTGRQLAVGPGKAPQARMFPSHPDASLTCFPLPHQASQAEPAKESIQASHTHACWTPPPSLRHGHAAQRR